MKNKFFPLIRFLFILASALLSMAALANESIMHYQSKPQGGKDGEFHPTGKGYGENNNVRVTDTQVNEDARDPIIEGIKAASKQSATTQYPNGIIYHGGPVMTTANVYYIWYGNWAGNTATSLLTNLAQNLAGSAYNNINTSYSTNTTTGKILNSVTYKSAISDNYSQGTVLTDAGVKNVVSNAIARSNLPNDPNGVYFVLTSADVNESSGFCTNYCGWHTNTLINGNRIKYAFVGNPARCLTSCAAQSTVSPNGNIGADGMASTVAHELSETITDPLLNAWYDGKGNENADKCAWQFGTVSALANGAKYNVTLGGAKYLLQQNWLNANGGSCKIGF